EPSRRGESSAPGKHSDRDGRSVPRAAALARQTQRTCLRRGSSARACRCEKLSARRNGCCHRGQFPPLLPRRETLPRERASANSLVWKREFRRMSAPGRKAITLLTVKEIFDLVRDDLALVEEELSRQTSVAFEPVAEITSYSLGGG